MSYKSELGRTWWLKNPAFKAYMLREATVLPLVFFILCMLAGIYSLGKGEQAWQSWVVVMGNPLVLTLNTLALVASLYHAATFFVLFPRVMPVRLGGQKVPDNLIVIAQWAGVAAVFVLAAWVFWGVL
jgi:fumarate reductase subunit C